MGFWDEEIVEAPNTKTANKPTHKSAEDLTKATNDLPLVLKKETPNLSTTATIYPNIHLNNKGKFVVYVYRHGKQHYVGTFRTIETAYEARLNFIESGTKPTPQPKGTDQLKELIDEFLSIHDNPHPQ